MLCLAALGGGLAGWVAHTFWRKRWDSFKTRRVRIEGVSKSVPVNRGPELAMGPSTEKRRHASSSSEVDTAGRVIVHLASLGASAYDEIGRVAQTQSGMCQVLSIRQGTLTKVLSRLSAARVVEVSRRHVAGQARRMNVYRLTALGETVARDMRRESLARSHSGIGGSDPTRLQGVSESGTSSRT